MLLRSSSTPISNSWIPHHYSSASPSPDHHHHHHNHNDNTIHLHLPRTKSVSSLTASSHSSSSSPSPNLDHSKPATRTLSDVDLRNLPSPLSKQSPTETTPFQRLFSSSGLDEAVVEEEEREDKGVDTIVESGGDGGDGMAGGGFTDNDDDCNSNSGDHGHGGGIEEHYLKMIKANPGNPLLLGNYAKFLKEVRGDLAKAEEYCGRAILVSPSDANMLALYADIIWETQRDAKRAESYFQQAVKNAPDDIYVLASYARFLWDVDEEEEEAEENKDKIDSSNVPSASKYLEHRQRMPRWLRKEGEGAKIWLRHLQRWGGGQRPDERPPAMSLPPSPFILFFCFLLGYCYFIFFKILKK